MGLLIKAGNVITGTESDSVKKHQGILIEDGRIRAVDHWEAFAPDDKVEIIDASPYTLMPGLIDAHTHITGSGEPDEREHFLFLTESPAKTALKSARHTRRHIEMGVTTVRVLGTAHYVDIALRDAINAGWIVGPRLVTAGPGITSTGGHMDRRKVLAVDIDPKVIQASHVVDSPYEARRAAWENLTRGADVIKINITLSEYVRARGGQCSPELSYEAVKAVCDLAHGAGRFVAAHCHGGPGIDLAIDAGVDTFEHGRFLTDLQLERMAELGRFLVPTLSPEARRVDVGNVTGTEGDLRWFKMATEAMYDTVERAIQRGVRVAAGTDVGMPHVRHGEIAYEMAHLTRGGMSNLAAIEAATRVAAEALDLAESIGQVRPGFVADLVIVDGNPVEDIQLLQRQQNILMVIQDGKIAVERHAGYPVASGNSSQS